MAQETRNLSSEAVVRPPAGEVYAFGPVRIDVSRHVVTRDGQPIALAPKTFELLLILVRSGGRALSRQELVAKLWADTFVEEANLSFQISTLRRVLGMGAELWIETVPKVGYRFTPEVTREAPTPATPPPARMLPGEGAETTPAPTLLTPDGISTRRRWTSASAWRKGTRFRALHVLASLCAVLAVALVALGTVYDRERQRSQGLRQLAAETFFQTRELAADLARLRRSGASSNTLVRSSYRLTRLEESYDRYLDLIGTYEGKTQVERAVMRMARRLGESELEVPAGFHALAMQYVGEWRTDAPLLQAALDRAREGHLLELVYKALDERALPRELFLLPLQESDFDIAAVGPPTPYGISKGMWGFIPSTATKYGLALGPLHNAPVYDALDERHDPVRSTDAAVRHLADLYSSPAAASGLLVIAAYNYGPDNVIKKLNELPNDPRDRNFWNFYRHKWLSDEAMNYVMSIFAAALICEDPALFDVPIERP